MKTALAISVAAAQFLGALSKSDWANLNKLAAGEQIKISMTDGKSYRGEFQSISPIRS